MVYQVYMTEQTVTAILVTYNNASVIATSLSVLERQAEISQIIVVDNYSLDDTHGIIARDFPNVRIIEIPKNDGFGRANNIALEKVQTPFVLLIKPDAVLEDGALAVMLDVVMKFPDAGLIVPMVVDANGGVHHNFKQTVFIRETDRPNLTQPSGGCCSEHLSDAVWLMTTEHARNILPSHRVIDERNTCRLCVHNTNQE